MRLLLIVEAQADADAASRCIAVDALGAIAARHPKALPTEAEGALRRIAARAEDGNLRDAAERALRRLAT